MCNINYQRLIFYLSRLDIVYIANQCYVCMCFTIFRQYCKFANKVTKDGIELGTSHYLFSLFVLTNLNNYPDCFRLIMSI